ncbi:TetR/AcrR family transcriptional regulator [Nocardiopsis coralliicola]
MPTGTRKERERAARRELILAEARRLAEAEGWEAVTTRRLSQLIEYSQPVLYAHFSGKGAIVAAVAEQGFGELAERIRAARAGEEPTGAPAAARTALAAAARAYLDFAADHPALYGAMFTMPSQLSFATAETPAALRESFAEIEDLAAPFAGPGGDAATAAETLWAALHGLVSLSQAGRLRTAARDDRIAYLVAALAAGS